MNLDVIFDAAGKNPCEMFVKKSSLENFELEPLPLRQSGSRDLSADSADTLLHLLEAINWAKCSSGQAFIGAIVTVPDKLRKELPLPTGQIQPVQIPQLLAKPGEIKIIVRLPTSSLRAFFHSEVLRCILADRQFPWTVSVEGFTNETSKVKLSALRRYLQRIPSISSDPDWLLSRRCEQCPHMQACREEAGLTGAVQWLPDLTRSEKATLRAVLDNQRGTGGPLLPDLEDIDQLVHGKDPLLTCSVPALRVINGESMAIKAWRTRSAVFLNQPTHLLSASGEIIVLTYHHSGAKTFYGYFCSTGVPLVETDRAKFAKSLKAILEDLDLAQFFTWEPYEKEGLRKELTNLAESGCENAALCTRVLFDDAVQLRLPEQRPLLPKDRQRTAVRFPCLSEVLQDLVVLPEAGFCRLSDYAGYFINGSGQGVAPKRKEERLSLHLKRQFDLLAYMRALLPRRVLFLPAPRCTLEVIQHRCEGREGQLLRKLLFIKQLETLIEVQESQRACSGRSKTTLLTLCQPPKTGQMFSTSFARVEFQVLCQAEPLRRDDRDETPSCFGQNLLVRVPESGELRSDTYFDDQYFQDKTADSVSEENLHPDLRLCDVEAVKVEAVEKHGLGQATQLLVTLRVYKHERFPFILGQRFFLRRRPFSLTANKAIAALSGFTADHIGLKILMDPIGHTGEPRGPILLPDGSLENMEASQQNAFRALWATNLLLLWGPPGCGKTYFLALAILRLMESGCGKFRVLVAANTHAALKALLNQILALPLPQGVAIFCDKTTLLHERVRNEFKKPEWCNSFVVVAATVWKCAKKLKDEKFDAVFIDEGTQLPVGDALLPLGLLKPNGRVVVAGDPLQLPPVMKAVYPLPATVTELVLHGSIMQALMRKSSGECVHDAVEALLEERHKILQLSVLSENHRSVQEISDFTARLYGQDYAPLPSNSRKYYKVAQPSVLAPNGEALHPLTTVRFEVGTNGIEDAEAEVISCLCEALDVATGNPQSSPDIFVITPHRSQQARLILPSRCRVRVDTVERMQGSEAPIVILALGLGNPEERPHDDRFVLQLQRLNVALTRAKQAVYVVVSDMALQLDPERFSPDIQRGIKHLQHYFEISRQLVYSGGQFSEARTV